LTTQCYGEIFGLAIDAGTGLLRKFFTKRSFTFCGLFCPEDKDTFFLGNIWKSYQATFCNIPEGMTLHYSSLIKAVSKFRPKRLQYIQFMLAEYLSSLQCITKMGIISDCERLLSL
jgi:hypothetical protein